MQVVRHLKTLLLSLVLFSSSRLHADEAQIREELAAKGALFAFWGVSLEDESRWSEADFRHLAQLRSIEWVAFNHGLTDRQLAHLESMPNVQTFVSDQGQLSDAGLKSLASFKKLRSLSLIDPGEALRGTGFAALSTLPELEDLSITRLNFISDEGMAAIAKLSHLQSLKIAYSELAELFRHPKDPDRWTALTDALANLPSLNKLSLVLPQGDSPLYLRRGALDGILKLTSLEQIELNGMELPVEELERLKILPHLKSIDLTDMDIDIEDLYQLRVKLQPVKIEHSLSFRHYDIQFIDFDPIIQIGCSSPRIRKPVAPFIKLVPNWLRQLGKPQPPPNLPNRPKRVLLNQRMLIGGGFLQRR